MELQNLDDKLRVSLTSDELLEECKKVKLVKSKLQHYESQCHRYSLQRVKMIQTSIEHYDSLERLCLDDYAIGTLQCQIMFDTFAMNPLTMLTQISLLNNQLEAFCCHSIAKFLEASSTLKELTLAGSKFDDEGAEILSRGVASSTSVRHFDFSNCNISDDGGELLAKSFLVNNVCRDLNLSFNTLALKSAKVFAEVLMTNESLVNLDLSHNSLYEDFAAVSLLKGLAENKSLEQLNLSWNSLRGEIFGKALPKAIKLSALRVLKLEQNRLTKFELKRLAIGAKRSETLEQLFVEGNMFADGDDEILVNIFKSDSPLSLLSFGDWFQLSQKALKLMQETLHVRPFKIIFQGVSLPNPPREVNMLDIFADRVKNRAMAPKKKFLKRDMRIFMTKLQQLDSAYLPKPDFIQRLKNFKAVLADDLIERYVEACTDEQKRLDVHLMANHFLNRHPYTPSSA